MSDLVPGKAAYPEVTQSYTKQLLKKNFPFVLLCVSLWLIHFLSVHVLFM